jgi:ABC-type branched-subunit amino acid transport system ATPase component
MEQILKVRGLEKSFGDFKAVDGLDLDVYRGDVFGFLGPNGAGKSTSIRMLLSLIKPTAGTIEIFGKNFENDRNYILSRIGSIVEKPDFYKYLSAKKNIEIFARLSGVSKSNSQIEELIEFVGLKGRGDDKVKNYSHGMKQRLGLAQALVHDPELIILDEPTTGLDPQGIIDIRNLILYLSKEKNKTIFLSSHILSEMELIATRMAIINKGKCVAQGSIHDLLNDDDRIVTITVSEVDTVLNYINASAWKTHINSVDGDTILFNLTFKQISELNKELVNQGFNIHGLESRRQLEDFFLKLTESAERMMV